MKVGAPVFYIQGTNDPSTSEWQARYHFDGQLGVLRYFIELPGAGHSPFNLLDCKDALWHSIFSSGDGLGAALDSCGSKPRLIDSGA